MLGLPPAISSHKCKQSRVGKHSGAARRLGADRKVEAVVAKVRAADAGLLNSDRVVARPERGHKPGRPHRVWQGITDLAENVCANISWAKVPPA